MQALDATHACGVVDAATPQEDVLLLGPMVEPPVPDYRQYFNPMLKALKALGGSASIEERPRG